MPYGTPEPVPLVQADEWVIGDIHIDPAGPSVTYQVLSLFDGREVRRRGRTIAGAELMAKPGAPQLYQTLKALIYDDAKEIGEIPSEATEITQQPDADAPA